jgi:hypothetical protein
LWASASSRGRDLDSDYAYRLRVRWLDGTETVVGSGDLSCLTTLIERTNQKLKGYRATDRALSVMERGSLLRKAV